MASPIIIPTPLQVQRIARAKPTKSPDGGFPQFSRWSQWGELYVQSPIPTKHLLSDEGSYFYATNPTVGTAVTYGINATYSATAAAFALKNNDQAGGAYKRIYMDFVRIAFTGTGATVPASATGALMVAVVDNINRTPTANNATPAIFNINGDDATGSIANLQAFSSGTLTLPTYGIAARYAGRAWMRHVIPVAGDELITMFGGIEAGGGVVGSTAGRIVSAAPALVIGPQQWALFYIYFPSNATTAAAFEYDLGWWER